MEKLKKFKNDEKVLDVLKHGNVVCDGGLNLPSFLKMITILNDILSKPESEWDSYFKFYSEKVLDSKMLKQFDSLMRLTTAGIDLDEIYHCLAIDYFNQCMEIRNQKIKNGEL